MTVDSSPGTAAAADKTEKTDKPATPAGTGQGAGHGESNVKETIESILVAFILAFIFRAFVVEAFVIPTGSMAPTLLGAHMRFTCDDCGYQWTVNFQVPSDGDRGGDENIPAFAQLGDGRPMTFMRPHPTILCPNCAYEVPVQNKQDPDNDAHVPPVHYGDRILVLKYVYLFQDPARWDVVVFKSPHEDARISDPAQARYAQNYIKRLVGRPGESVMILDGDVYVSTDPDADPQTHPEAFRIQRKPRVVQGALWRTVYDNDFIPHLTEPPPQPPVDPRYQVTPRVWRQPWQVMDGGKGWDLHPGTPAARAFDFDNPGGGSTLFFNPNANPGTFPLTDWLAYDQVSEQVQPRTRKETVGDLRVTCYYHRRSGDGPLRLTLSRGPDTFAAELTPGAAVIRRLDANGKPVAEFPAAGGVKELAGSEPVELEFTNVDYRVALRVNGREVATTGDAYQPDVAEVLARRGVPQPPPAVRIAAERQACRVSHLVLSRDVYYLEGGPHAFGRPDKLIHLGPEEYFVLGDNSLISGDARTWVDEKDRVDLPAEDLYVEPGRVPKRFLLGKAFFVYWPAGYRPWSSAPGMIPNFGEMRFIH